MRVDDARPALPFEPLLIVGGDQAAKAVAVTAVGGGVPGLHERPRGIPIRHVRALLERVDVRIDEVPKEAYFLPAHIPPEIRAPFDVPLVRQTVEARHDAK